MYSLIISLRIVKVSIAGGFSAVANTFLKRKISGEIVLMRCF